MSAQTRTSPVDGIGEVGRRRLVLLGALGALKALGLVLVADALATGIVTVIAHGDVLPVVAEGLAGAVLRAASVWCLRVVSQSAAAGVKGRLRRRLAHAYLGRTGGSIGADASIAATGLDDLDAYFTTYLPSLVGAVTVPLLVGARILAADWVSALVIVVTVPLIPLFMALIGMHTRERVAASLDALSRLSDHLVELARGLPVLVGLGRDREQTRALAEISDDHRRRSMAALRTAFLSALALDLLATLSVAVVAVLIGIRLLHGQLTLEAGLVALILAPECYAPIREVGAAFHASDLGREAFRRARTAIGPARASTTLLRRRGGDVEVHALTVTHAGRVAPAVSGLTFRAPAGSLTLLAGDSGAGKSTVLGVLAGRGAALDPDARCTGTITTPPSGQIAWMPQQPQFCSRTVLDELAVYSADPADRQACLALLDRVGLHDLAEHAPGALSPGEARRLAWARVLAAVDAGARLVLVDEPTAHLDANAAALIRAELAALRRRATIVVASHDPAIRALADHTVSVATAGQGREPSPNDLSAPWAVPALPEAGDAARRADAPTPPAPEGGRSAPAMPSPIAGNEAERGGAGEELASFLRPVRWRCAAAVVVGAFSSAFAIALTAVSGWLIVRASQEPAIMYLLVAIVGVRFFGIGRSVLRYAERLLTHDAVFRATTALRVRLWRALAAAGPAGRGALSPANTLAALVGAADRMRDLVPRTVQPPLAAATVLAGSVVALGALYGPAALLLSGLAVVGLLIVPALALTAGRRAARRGESTRAAVLLAFTDLLGARDDLTPAAARRLVRRIEEADETAASSEHGTAMTEGAASALVVLACCCAAVAMIPLAAGAVASGVLRPELVAVLALLPLALVEPLLDGAASFSRAPALARVLEHVHRVASLVPGVATHEPEPGSGPETIAGVDGIVLDQVTYRYPHTYRPVFAAVSGGAGRGQWLAVTGPSGSGKSTLLALLMRFADPTAGRYELRQGRRRVDARMLPPHRLRARVAWCPQEGHLFDSTLRANLLIARPGAERPSEAELMDAITRVGLAPLLASLPLGLDTRVGAGGQRLSGGQRQRVAVARTLLTGGDVVLIDEPTAQLDEQASAALMADLRVALRERTTVLVTHDAAEARCAEHLIDLGAPAVPAFGGRSAAPDPSSSELSVAMGGR